MATEADTIYIYFKGGMWIRTYIAANIEWICVLNGKEWFWTAWSRAVDCPWTFNVRRLGTELEFYRWKLCNNRTIDDFLPLKHKSHWYSMWLKSQRRSRNPSVKHSCDICGLNVNSWGPILQKRPWILCLSGKPLKAEAARFLLGL